jgi:hypothetical protein
MAKCASDLRVLKASNCLQFLSIHVIQYFNVSVGALSSQRRSVSNIESLSKEAKSASEARKTDIPDLWCLKIKISAKK